MHTMCSYHGMFPAKLAHYFIQRYTRPDGVVLDPFSGRGTVALQARAEGRRSICNDLSPLAYVLSQAKAKPPLYDDLDYLARLEKRYRHPSRAGGGVARHPDALPREHAQAALLYPRPPAVEADRLDAGRVYDCRLTCGIMHGSWRRDATSQYLSISMPNTFSMSPSYVEKFIREKGLTKLDQDVFGRLRDKLARLYLT